GVAESGHRVLIADVGRDLRRLLAVEVEDHDGPAFAGIALGDGHADAAVGSCAGDDGGTRGGHGSPLDAFGLDEFGNQVPRSGGGLGPFVVGAGALFV